MSLQDLLKKRIGEVKPPPPIPMGTYLVAVTSNAKFLQVGKENTDAYDFEITILQPGEDVDPVELGNLPEGVTGRKLRARFFATEDAFYRLTEWLEKLGFDAEDDVQKAISETMGRRINAKVTHRSYMDGDVPKLASEISAWYAI